MLVRAKRRLRLCPASTVELREKEVTRLDFPAGSFDAAVATFLFCVLPDERQLPALRELRRVVRPGSAVRLLEYVRPRRLLRGAIAKLWEPWIAWAYGASFDRKTGDLWGGEVGQDLWEMIYKVQKGGNYGWSVMEGTHDFRPERKKGPTPILKPVVEHGHESFRSITGGFVYGGKRLPELAGNYVYGDFDTGRVWTFKPTWGGTTNKQATQKVWVEAQNHREIARTTYRIVTWGEDADGEIYYVTENATTFVIAAKPKYELIATNKLADTSRTNASPVIDNGRLLIRTDTYLYCVGKK